MLPQAQAVELLRYDPEQHGVFTRAARKAPAIVWLDLSRLARTTASFKQPRGGVGIFAALMFDLPVKAPKWNPDKKVRPSSQSQAGRTTTPLEVPPSLLRVSLFRALPLFPRRIPVNFSCVQSRGKKHDNFPIFVWKSFRLGVPYTLTVCVQYCA